MYSLEEIEELAIKAKDLNLINNFDYYIEDYEYARIYIDDLGHKDQGLSTIEAYWYLKGLLDLYNKAYVSIGEY